MGQAVMTVSGCIGRDATSRVTQSGKACTSVSVPCESGYGDREVTTWVKCEAWGGSADYLATARKGDVVCISGVPSIETWQSDAGERHGLKIAANVVKILKRANPRPAVTPQDARNHVDDYDIGDTSTDIPPLSMGD